MRSVQVQFASGREVLNSYWGFLRNGGLVLAEPWDLSEGDSVGFDVGWTSSGLRVTVIKPARPPRDAAPD